MSTFNWNLAVASVFIMFLSAACSKKLMPPEIETSSGGIESSDFTASNNTQPAEGTFGGTGGAQDSGFFSEEPVLEGSDSFNGSGSGTDNGRSGEPGRMAGGDSFGSATGPGGSEGSPMGGFGSSDRADIGNGSKGAFEANPFVENDGGTSGGASGFGSSDRADIGNGSKGAFEANPFVENDGGTDSGGASAFGSFGRADSGTGSGGASGFGSSGRADIGNGSSGKFGSGGGSGNQEARLHSYHETSDLKDIHFSFDQYDLDSNSKKVLQGNAAFLKQNPGLKVEIQGHCDERGTNNYNIALGERRAHSTKKFLVSQGVDPGRVNIISYGEEKPFCFDSNENCWFQNRRAHFMVSK